MILPLLNSAVVSGNIWGFYKILNIENVRLESGPHESSGILIVFQQALSLMVLWCLIRCWFSDPGYIEYVPGAKSDSSTRDCSRCHRWKPPRAHHCRRCKRCVFRMDHHCIWINNCVGYQNQKSFTLFLLYLTTLGLVGIIQILIIAFTCYMSSHPQPYWPIQIILIIINSLAAYFGKTYLSEQLEAIESNTTLIETYQNTRGEVGTDNFRQIFGHSPWLWPFPLGTQPPNFSEPVSSMSNRLSMEDADSLGVDASPTHKFTVLERLD